MNLLSGMSFHVTKFSYLVFMKIFSVPQKLTSLMRMVVKTCDNEDITS